MSYQPKDRRYAGEKESFLKPFYEAMGSIPFIPHRSGDETSYIPPRTRGSSANSWLREIENKQRELDQYEEHSNPWKKREETVDPVDPVEPDPVVPDPEPEIDPEKKAAQEKWKGIWANQIAEGISMDDAMRSSRTVTPEEWEDYKWAFSEDTDLNNWKKWGGGNKMGSGGAKINADRKSGERSGPGLGFHIGQMARDVTARFSDTQGRGIKTGADGFGYSNHSRKHSYNTHGVGERSAPF